MDAHQKGPFWPVQFWKLGLAELRRPAVSQATSTPSYLPAILKLSSASRVILLVQKRLSDTNHVSLNNVGLSIIESALGYSNNEGFPACTGLTSTIALIIEARDISRNMKIAGFPTILFIPYGDVVTEYGGNRSAES